MAVAGEVLVARPAAAVAVAVAVAVGVDVGLDVGAITGVRVGEGVTFTNAGVIDGGGTSSASCVAWHAATAMMMVATSEPSTMVACLECISGVAFRGWECGVRLVQRVGTRFDTSTYSS